MNLNKKINNKDFLYCLLLAISFLLICSKNSPLYPMNDWVDVDCIFTVGKSLNNGAVLYRDIFDHKGPFLYFLYSIAAFISDTSYIGLWIFEIISITGFFFFSIKCVRLFTTNDRYLYAVLPIFALFVLTTNAFAHGGSTEELTLLPLTYSLYYFLRVLNKKEIKQIEHFLVGACVGIVFWMKYTIVGFYLGAYVYLLIYVIAKKDLQTFLNMLKNFAGFVIITLFVIGYFAYHSALMDLWEVYFYGNIFLYGEKASLFSKIYFMIANLVGTSFVNKLLFFPTYIGFLWMLIKRRKETLFCVLSFATSVLGIFFGTAYNYYSLVLATFAFLGLYPVCDGLAKLFESREKFKFSKGIPVISMILCIILSIFLSENTYLLKYDKSDMPQYKFATIINSVEDATLLNYHFLDGGFYFAADIIPENKFFYFSNLPAPEMEADQNQMIENKEVDFVVTRNAKLEDYLNTTDYTLIATETFFLEDAFYDYYLYQKNDIN